MVSVSSAPLVPTALKILIAGGFGVGKTTMVGSVSEVTPLATEEHISSAGRRVDDLRGVENKVSTTVALDFGRITFSPELVLYLFGTPGQDRFWFMWDDLCSGALGAVVLADTRRLDACFPAVDFFESGAPWRDGSTPVNVSGGLQSKGHPISATGIANVWEVAHHLRGEAGPRQIEGAKVGLAHVIGLGSACGVHILEKSAA